MTNALTYNHEDLRYLVATMWGECRGEPFDGMVAVAHTIRNRVEKDAWYGHSVKDVCTKPFQFSCWNHDDRNHGMVANIAKNFVVEFNMAHIVRELTAAAMLVLEGKSEDTTMGSTHYHTRAVEPEWSKDKDPVASIGAHRFFNSID